MGDSGDVTEVLGDFEEGEEVSIQILRKKRKMTVKAKLEERDRHRDIRIFHDDADQIFNIRKPHVERLLEIKESGQDRRERQKEFFRQNSKKIELKALKERGAMEKRRAVMELRAI